MKTKKQYKLSQWYPSLHQNLKHGGIAIYDADGHYMVYDNKGVCYEQLGEEEIENNSEYWQLIEEKKPLFVTEDGVEVLSDIDNLYAVNLTYFNKTKHMLRHSSWLIENSAYKVFYHEENADTFIWRNKRVFSYDDFQKFIEREDRFYDIKSIAKERAKE